MHDKKYKMENKILRTFAFYEDAIVFTVVRK